MLTRVLVLCAVVGLVTPLPLDAAATPSESKGIYQSHELPAPYHKTDDVLKFVQGLSKDCKTGAFTLEFYSGAKAMDLEMETAPFGHGKSDDFFDFQVLKTSSSHSLIELEAPQPASQNKAPPAVDSLPKSWKDKSTPPNDLPVVRVSIGDKASKPSALIMFGEHGRELISCEIGMEFLRSIHSAACETNSATTGDSTSFVEIEESDYAVPGAYSAAQVRQLLSEWNLVIMPVVSPSAREIAEKSNFCNRKNANGVDVNRNYPFHFGEGQFDESSEQFPGVQPLTEPETRIAARLAQEVRPKLFIAVHSGAEMLVTSPAYRKVGLSQMPSGVQKVVHALQSEDCPECAVGPASQVLSYLAHGCSMDYMFEQGFSNEPDATKPSEEHFSFTFETWEGDREQKRVKSLDLEREFGDRASAVRQMEDSFNELKTKVGHEQFSCLTRFNPPPSLYDWAVHRWTKTLFSTLHAVRHELASTGNNMPTVTAPAAKMPTETKPAQAPENK